MKKEDLLKEVTANELLLKIEETENLNEIMMGSLRILDNLSRTEVASHKLQDEINVLLEELLKNLLGGNTDGNGA